MGPAISLIGLELASLAVEDTGFTSGNQRSVFLSVFTLAAIILASLIKRKFLRNASVLIGISIGCLTAASMGEFDIHQVYATSSFFQAPDINFLFSMFRLICSACSFLSYLLPLLLSLKALAESPF